MQLRGDAGAGSLLAVAVIGAVLAMSLLLVPLYTVLAARVRVEGAADAAALAAADVAIGIVPGVPCAVAAAVAEANGATLTECHADGVIVTVGVSTTILGFPVRSAATAGPPGAAPQ
ncbi:MAG TPA: Rv3654c family TadE-like protein [Terrimesophilobacter sp.]|uniref:Rv3654c family TadE-like protein n=1 Tax=Terrimesophilobacter sp. TaxID=2906435 RepID=UPI002F95B925